MLDVDTPLTEHSLSAATNFCGAAIQAVDVLMGDHMALKDLVTKERHGSHIHSHNHNLTHNHDDYDDDYDNTDNANIDNKGDIETSSGCGRNDDGEKRVDRAFVIGRPPGRSKVSDWSLEL